MGHRMYLKKLHVGITDIELLKKWIACGRVLYMYADNLFHIIGFFSENKKPLVRLEHVRSGETCSFPLVVLSTGEASIDILMQVKHKKNATHSWVVDSTIGEIYGEYRPEEEVVSVADARIEVYPSQVGTTINSEERGMIKITCGRSNVVYFARENVTKIVRNGSKVMVEMQYAKDWIKEEQYYVDSDYFCVEIL